MDWLLEDRAVPRKSRVEISSRAIGAELFESYHEHLEEYCKVSKKDKRELLEAFIRGLQPDDDGEFPSVDDRIVNYFHALRPKTHAPARSKSSKSTGMQKRSPKAPATPASSNKSDLASQFSSY